MPTIEQIRGMLLEEAVLHLLRHSGYKTIEAPNNDPTLRMGHAGLEVIGRGSVHQIDAIADFALPHPFSHPQRLLVEAKFKKSHIGIEVLRNTVGVLKDVGEYWVTTPRNPGRNIVADDAGTIAKNRYHYQYAIFSASDFAQQAQNYAFAHDIYLVPLAKSKFVQPIINAIRQVRTTVKRVGMADLRAAVRESLRSKNTMRLERLVSIDMYDQLKEVIAETDQVNQAVLGMIANQFPVFFVSSPGLDITTLHPIHEVRILWDEEAWYLRDAQTDERLFSFDLPKILFSKYADEGILTRTRALDFKEDILAEIQAIITTQDRPRVIIFRLDRNWIRDVRQRIAQQNNRSQKRTG